MAKRHFSTPTTKEFMDAQEIFFRFLFLYPQYTSLFQNILNRKCRALQEKNEAELHSILRTEQQTLQKLLKILLHDMDQDQASRVRHSL